MLFLIKSRPSVLGMSNREKDTPDKFERKAGGIHTTEEQDNDSSSDSLEHLHSISPIKNKISKLFN